MTLPTLVLLPGLHGNGVLFRPLLESLPSAVTAIVVSYPEHQPLGYRELLPIVLAALPTSGPFVLLGESFSGPLAILAAATRPRGLVGVVLCGSFVRNPHPCIPSWAAVLVRPWQFRLFPRFSRWKALLSGYSTEALRELIQEALSRVAPAVLACRVREVLRADVTRELASCTVPVLYLRGTNDWVVPAWNVASVRRCCPQLQVAEFPAPHLVLQVATAPALEVILRMLRDHSGAGGGNVISF